jgi:hypothetical protein
MTAGRFDLIISLFLTSTTTNIPHDQESTMKKGIATSLILILITSALEISQCAEVSSGVPDIVLQLPSPSSALTSCCDAAFF